MDVRGPSPKWYAGVAQSGRLARRMMVVAVGVLTLWVAAPAVASAQPAWGLNYVPLSSSRATEWNGKIALSIVSSEELECTEKGEGSVGASGAGEVTKLTMTKCFGIKICKKVEAGALTALNLPWHSELVVVEGALRDKLVNGGKGAPGFKLECTGTIVPEKYVVECTGTFSATLTNGEGVIAAFNSSEKLTCTEGGAGSGTVIGSQTITTAGGTLTAEKEEPVWLKQGVPIEAGEGANPTEWPKATMEMYNFTAGGTIGVKCEESGEGSVGVGGVGTITKFTFTNCVKGPQESVCNSAYSIAAVHLPWNTQLFMRGTAVEEAYTSSGAGTPLFVIKCHTTSGGEPTNECESFQSLMKNSVSTVLSEFIEAKKCSGSSGSTYARFFEVEQKLALQSGHTLQVS